MPCRLCRTILPIFFLFLSSPEGVSQDAVEDSENRTVVGDGIPLKLDLSRRFLKNFLTDEAALEPYHGIEGSVNDFHGAFTLAASEAPYAVIWEPTACRIVGVLDLNFAPEVDASAEEEANEAEGSEESTEPSQAPSPYLLTASGLAPLAKSEGAFGAPEYFGFRLVEGKPEFLYLHGKIAMEERVWLESNGTVLKQRYATRDAIGSLKISVPPEWQSVVSSDLGEWDENVLTVESEDPLVVTLSYRLEKDEPAPEEETP